MPSGRTPYDHVSWRTSSSPSGMSPLPRSPEALFPSAAQAAPYPQSADGRPSSSRQASSSSPTVEQAEMLGRRGSWSLNDFDIGPKLGEGRFGKIYLCREKISKYAVVLKLIAKEAVINHDIVHQIQREIELHMYCKHRNIIRLLAYFWDDERVFLVLDYADEGNLATLLQSVPSGQRLSEWAVRQLAGQLCSAVLYLHRRGILHRDIKPENILFKKGCLKLADFTWAVYVAPPATTTHGARTSSAHLSPIQFSSPYRGQQHESPNAWEDAQRKRRRLTICGTLDYLPPEMILRRAYDEAADMWCVGATVYEMLVGRPPFETSTVRETEERIVRGQFAFPRLIRDQLSWEVVDFVTRLLNTDPARRMSAEQAAMHPFVEPVLREERARSHSMRDGRSRSEHHLASSSNGERREGEHKAAPSSSSDSRVLHYSGVSVSACTTILGATGGPSNVAVNSSSASAAHLLPSGAHNASSVMSHHPHHGVSHMSHIAQSGFLASSTSLVGHGASNVVGTTTIDPSGTTLSHSQLPSNVTQASTQEGHDDAAGAMDGGQLSVPDVSNITAAPPGDDAQHPLPPADVERALEFDLALAGGGLTSIENQHDGKQEIAGRPSAPTPGHTPPGDTPPHTPVKTSTQLHQDHDDDDAAPDVSAVMMATSALPSPVPLRRPTSPAHSGSDISDDRSAGNIDISSIGAW